MLVKSFFMKIAEMIYRVDPFAAFAFEMWDGEIVGGANQPKVVLQFKSLTGAKHILAKGYLGLGEAYMLGELDVKGDLRELFRLGIAIDFDGNRLSPLSMWNKIQSIFSFLPGNTPERARRFISHHYDRGNDFYALFLDPTMTYSCAYFKNSCDSLEQAQINKFEHIARKLALCPGDRLLDIGCGWGAMLIYAAQKYGITGIGNTLSQNQYEYANQRIRELGLEDRIQVVLEDYRSLTGEFDKIVSIGMFEHVGKRFIPAYMQTVSKLLKKGGVGLLHTIGKDIDVPTDPWTTRYIFPGGYLPNLSEIVKHMGLTDLPVLDIENLRLHYASTLERWAENFDRNAGKVREMYDETFARMWRFYLNSCIAGFEYGAIRLYQILFSNGLNNRLPMTREHIYRET